jgi:tetratricopeptide (TPR) repeat protein
MDGKDYVRAIADLSEAIRIDLQTQQGEAFASRGDACFMQNDFARATADYDRAIKINRRTAPLSPTPHRR